jgi:hypothetical protein
MNTTVRVLLGIGAVAVAVLLLVVLKDDGEGGSGETTTATRPAAPPSGAQPADTPPPRAQVTTIVLDEAGRPVDGVAEIAVDAGDDIRFKVESPVADEVHVHGYDVEKAVPAGGAAVFDFPADIEGIFEVELHHGEEQIAELRVSP